MKHTPHSVDFDDVPDTYETEQTLGLESFLSAARAAHEERIRGFWLRFGPDYDDERE